MRKSVSILLEEPDVYTKNPEKVGQALLESTVSGKQIVDNYDLDTILRAMSLIRENNPSQFTEQMQPLLVKKGLGGYIPRVK